MGEETEIQCGRRKGVPSSLHTHCLLSGSCSPIFSSTLISSLAASPYFSKFLMIFRAIRLPPLCVETWFKSWKHCNILFQLSLLDKKKCTCCGPNIAPPSQMFPLLKCRLSHLQNKANGGKIKVGAFLLDEGCRNLRLNHYLHLSSRRSPLL